MTEDQLSTIWKSVMKEVEVHYSPMVFKTWFKNTSLFSLKPNEAQITVENSFAKNFIKKYAEDRIISSLSNQVGYPVTLLNYVISENKKAKEQNQSTADLFAEATGNNTVNVPVYDLPSNESVGASNLNPKYTFATFIVGTRNRLAYAAAQAVAESPSKAYNPLYLYGGVGLGKTHLMQAVGNEIVARQPQKKVLYVSCEHFTNEFTAAVRSNKIDSFKKKYRNVDIFLVDDIQFIAGKDGTQEEFFHTFNTLYQTDKQIIITSDKAPSDIKDLEERLSSRFSSGMIADMQLPDLETRQAILQAKCEEKGITLPDQVLLMIADLVETNIREMEGALNTYLAYLRASDQDYSLEGVREALKSFTTHKPLKRTSMETIRQIVCEYYGVDFKEITGKCRQQEIVKPRQVLMYLLKHELGMTFPTIGREIGGRDHTTAMHAVDKIEKEMKKSPELLDELQRIKELFYVGSR